MFRKPPKEEQSFSIIAEDKTLDLECNNPSERDRWVAGLNTMLHVYRLLLQIFYFKDFIIILHFPFILFFFPLVRTNPGLLHA